MQVRDFKEMDKIATKQIELNFDDIHFNNNENVDIKISAHDTFLK